MAYVEQNTKDAAIWRPNIKVVDGKEVEFTEASRDAHLEGYYLGKKSVTTKNGEVSLHSFKLIKAGIPECISGELADDKKVSVWGSRILDDSLAEVPQGTKTMILWDGKRKAQTGGNTYHVFRIFLDLEAEPFGGEAAPVGAVAQSTPEPASNLMEGQKDDGLPF